MKKKTPLLELIDITKKFGSFYANNHINLNIYPGEVHAILGENGAGKSTLMNILYGMYQPDGGVIKLNGETMDIHSSKDALNVGIGMVHQHFMLVDTFTAAENVFLMGDSPWWKIKRDDEIQEKLRALEKEYGIDVDVNCPIDQLSIGMQQKVEILKLLYTGANVLILDEPTAVLLPQEADILFEIIERLKADGKSILFISHKLDEVMRISDRITVLSQGEVIGQMETKDANKEKVVQMMVGEEIETMDFRRSEAEKKKELVLRATNLHATDDRGVTTLNGVSFELHKGEIVGVASLEGNGQNELAELISGVRPLVEGRLHINGRDLSTAPPQTFIEENIAYVPADRNKVGSVKGFPLYENWVLRTNKKASSFKWIDYKRVKKESMHTMKEYDVRARSIYDVSGNLSGGNLQKFILARELHKDPQVLVCSYPTRGLDIKASHFIRKKLLDATENGLSTLLFSSDFEELFALSNRLVVLSRGKIVAELVPSETTIREVGKLMMGVSTNEDEL